jgi:dolichol-phosphate mannosyltransferase
VLGRASVNRLAAPPRGRVTPRVDRNDESAARPPAARLASRTTVVLVVPTRNEAAHIEPFLERVEAALAPYPIDWHAEMIDDSEDETTSMLRGLARRGAPIRVTHRDGTGPGGGLGGAVRAGLARARGSIVCVIDADLQHPPEILPELLAPIVLGRADICVGSRYRRGGSAAGLQSPWRRLAARGSGVALQWLLPPTRLTSDPGSGLFAMRREVLDSVELRPTGSRVLAEILVRARWRTICDVPYRFAVTGGGNADLGVADLVAVGRELVTLWRWRPWMASLRNRRSHRRRGGRRFVWRRVAPVHVEFLRKPPLDRHGSGLRPSG